MSHAGKDDLRPSTSDVPVPSAFVLLEHRRSDLGCQTLPIAVYFDERKAAVALESYSPNAPRHTVAVVPIVD